MAFIGSILGAGQGSDWSAPQSQNNAIQSPTTQGQLEQGYKSSQSGLEQQQQFLNALQAQNGIGNQNAAYNAYAGLANGTGPNPAMAQLNQTTGANVANQAALMAGQRGSSANAGLIARQAAMQGANTQQQAVGQGATLQAQQALSGIQGMAGIAGSQVANQANATQNYNQAAQSEQSNLLGGLSAYNNAQANLAGSQNSSNAQIQVQNTKAQSGILGGALSFMAEGGMVGKSSGKIPMYADGGDVGSSGPRSNVGKFLFSSTGNTGVAAPTGAGAYFQNINTADNDDSQAQAGYQKVGQVFMDKTGLKGKVSNYVNGLLTPSVDPNGIGAQFNVNAAPNLGVQGVSPPPAAPSDFGGLGADTGFGGPTDFGAQSAPEFLAPDVASGTAAADAAAASGGGAEAAGLGTTASGEAVGEAAAGGAAAAGEGAAAASEGAEAAEGASGAVSEIAELFAAKGGKITGKSGKKVPALVSPGEVYLSPGKVKEVAKGKADPIKDGKKVPGKAAVKGNSYANDTVPAKLDEGGIVIPRSVMNSKDPAGAAHAFVSAILAKQNMKRGK